MWNSYIFGHKYLNYTFVCVIVFYMCVFVGFSNLVDRSVNKKQRQAGMKYILRWVDSSHDFGLGALKQGRTSFINNKCEYSNCYVTKNQNYFNDPTEFHAVVFFGKHLESLVLPQFRSPKQKFVFATLESAHYYPICRKQFDNYFNWTWTFRLDSDVKWGYLTVYDEAERPVGPGAVAWRDTYDPLPDRVRKRLKTKHKAAAWFVSNCDTMNKREVLVENITRELQLFNMTVDIYGACAQNRNNKCKRKYSTCYRKLEHEYYFYLAFENSFDKDYVTEKVLTAYNNYVVPIVYGDAEYSRFLPPGSYLNARDYSVKDLVQIMRGIMSNASLYEDLFRWKNHYRLKLTFDNEDLCKICAIMNDNTKLETISVYENFRQWWNGKHECLEY